MSETNGATQSVPYTDAFAEWDDAAHLFRVYLVPVVPEDDDDFDPIEQAKPMEPEYIGASFETRLHRATFIACPKDIGALKVGDPLGWPKEAPAKRVAKAVKAEIARAVKGEPGPDDATVAWAAQIAKMLGSGKRSRKA